MRPLKHAHCEQKSRRDACARVRGGQSAVAAAQVAAVAMLGTVFTTKINPLWASGGLLTEEDT